MNDEKRKQIDDYLPDSLPAGAPERPRLRPRSRTKWNPNQWRAAAMRARQEPWQVVADYLGISHSTVTKYVTACPGWLDLHTYFVDYYRQRRIEDFLTKEEDTVLEGTDAALALLVDVIKGKPDEDGKRPSLWVRSNVAFRFLDVVGYSESKRVLARAQVERELDDTDYDDGDEDELEVDPRIEYIDADVIDVG